MSTTFEEMETERTEMEQALRALEERQRLAELELTRARQQLEATAGIEEEEETPRSVYSAQSGYSAQSAPDGVSSPLAEEARRATTQFYPAPFKPAPSEPAREPGSDLGDEPHEREQPHEGRQVLLVYPRDMDAAAVERTVRGARDSLLLPADNLTLLWAGFCASTAGSGAAKPRGTSTGDSLQLPPDTVSEEIDRIRECAPAVATLLESGALPTTAQGSPRCAVKAFPRAELRWTLQQELHAAPAGTAYSLVLLPCNSGGGAEPDTEMERFVVEHSPVPVALVRCPPPE